MKILYNVDRFECLYEINNFLEKEYVAKINSRRNRKPEQYNKF